jgi:hypothetical protein
MSRPLTHPLCPQVINPRLSLVDPCPPPKEEHVAQLESLDFDCPMVEALAKMWKPLEDEGYEMYAMYTSADGSALEGNASSLICSASPSGLR